MGSRVAGSLVTLFLRVAREYECHEIATNTPVVQKLRLSAREELRPMFPIDPRGFSVVFAKPSPVIQRVDKVLPGINPVRWEQI